VCFQVQLNVHHDDILLALRTFGDQCKVLMNKELYRRSHSSLTSVFESIGWDRPLLALSSTKSHPHT
jgi:hypothetical protein